MKQSGFTLIEVMITVVIVGILTTIALPSYRDYVIRGKIPEATSDLSAKQLLLEQYFQDNRTYAGAPVCTADATSSQNFDFSCPGDSVTVDAFQLKAVGKGAMQGFTFTLNQSGMKTTDAVPLGWAFPSPNRCWVTRKGGVC